MFTLNDLSPEEKLKRYNELNSIPSADAYLSYESNPTQEQEVNSPKIDYTDMVRTHAGDNPLLFSTPTSTIPKVDDTEIEGTTSKPVLDPTNPYSKIVPLRNYTPTHDKLDFNAFEQTIRNKESSNKYDAVPKDGKSTASGYYQFIWSKWKDSIGKVTGIKTREDFLKSPEDQKKFFKFYYDSSIVPAVNSIKKDLGNQVNLSDFDLAQLVHFRGAAGAEDMIRKGELNTKKESNNPTAMQYITRS